MKTKLKATPGPWELHETGSIVGPKLDDKKIWLRPVIARFETGVKREDALLIAAAPDLYAALQKTALVLSGEAMTKGELIKALQLAQAALAKARGEQ